MSGKSLFFLGILAASGYALQRTAPPIPMDATAADSAAVSQAGVGSRFQYGVGSVGSWMVGGTVRGMANETEQTLLDLKGPIKSARGGEGDRARKTAVKAEAMNNAALEDLRLGRPIKAVRGAMEAASLVGAVRTQIKLKA